MDMTKLHRAVAAAAAAAITFGIFSSVASIASEDQARLSAARSVQVLAVAQVSETTNR